jgi:hypothetical protein
MVYKSFNKCRENRFLRVNFDEKSLEPDVSWFQKQNLGGIGRE